MELNLFNVCAVLSCPLIFHNVVPLCAHRSQRLIQAAFSKNDLLKNLDEGEISAIIACMYPTTINQGCCVIQEGTCGAQAYVLEGKSFPPIYNNIHHP